MAGFIDKTKTFKKYGTLTIRDTDYRMLSPMAFKVLKIIRLDKSGSGNAQDIANELDTSANSVRRRISELREHGFDVYVEKDAIFPQENRYYVRD